MLASSPEVTENLGRTLAAALLPGDVITLEAPLGGGKTTLTRGLCRGLGIAENEVSSPTFVLLQIYHGRLPVYHFDLYRLNRPQELHPIGAEDYIWGDGVAVLEWPGLATELLPPDRLAITIEFSDDEQGRLLHLLGLGRWAERLEKLCL